MSDPGVRFQELLKSISHAPPPQSAVTFTGWSLSAEQISPDGTVSINGAVTITSTSGAPLTWAALSLNAADGTILATATVVASNADVPPPLVAQVIVTASSNVYQMATHGANLLAIAGGEVNGGTYVSPSQPFTVTPL